VVIGLNFRWREGRCRILTAHPPNPCHTVRCLVPSSSPNDTRSDLVTSVFGGFPVANNFHLTSSPTVSFKSAARSFTVQSLPTGQYGVIDVMTLLMAASEKTKDTSCSNNSSSSTSSDRPRASCTGVVHSLIRSCIFPSVLLPAKQLYTSGLLLSGPPGVGNMARVVN
jgi:hypothetical protein